MQNLTAETVAPSAAKKARPGALLQVLAIALIFLGLILGWAWFQAGSPTLMAPYLRGECLLVEPTTITLGHQDKLTVIDRTVRLVNRTSHDVAVLGAQKSCGCIALDEFPLTVKSGESRELKMQVGMPYEAGAFEKSVKFFTDDEDLSIFVVKVAATVP